jgi:ribosome-binding protein aMBF1 (putative translation factor)
MISGGQVKAARQLLGWSPKQLADKARLSRSSVLVCESGEKRQYGWIVEAIECALESAGVQFLEGATPQIRPLFIKRED